MNKFRILLFLLTPVSLMPSFATANAIFNCKFDGKHLPTNTIVQEEREFSLEYIPDEALPEGILATAELKDLVLSRSSTLTVTSFQGDGTGATDGSKFSYRIKLTNNYNNHVQSFFADKIPNQWAQNFSAFDNQYHLSCKKQRQ